MWKSYMDQRTKCVFNGQRFGKAIQPKDQNTSSEGKSVLVISQKLQTFSQ